MTLAANVKFVMTDAEMKNRGFQTFGNGNWLHPSYPGMIFRLIQGFADAQANGGLFAMFGSNANDWSVYGRKKIIFGGDVGYHAYKDADGNFPRLNALPIHERVPYVIPGASLGTYAFRGQEADCFRTISGLSGTRWVGNFGDFVAVLSVISRVPRGMLYQYGTNFQIRDEDITGAEILAHPRSKLEGYSTYLENHPASAYQRANAEGKSGALYCDSPSSGKTRSFNYVAGDGGRMFLTVDIDVRKFVAAAKAGFLLAQDSDIRSEYEEAWQEAAATLPTGSVPFAMPFAAIWPTNASEVLKFTTAVGKVPRAMCYAIATWSRPQSVADSNPDDWHEKTSVVTAYGQYPRGDQPSLGTVYGMGEPNVTGTWLYSEEANWLPELETPFTFFKAPNFSITDELGTVVANSATIFGRMSPLTRPASGEIQLKMRVVSERLDALRSSGFREGKLRSDGSLNQDDPMFLTKAQAAGEQLDGTIYYQGEEIYDLEPFSGTLCAFGNKLTELVNEKIDS